MWTNQASQSTEAIPKQKPSRKGGCLLLFFLFVFVMVALLLLGLAKISSVPAGLVYFPLAFCLVFFALYLLEWRWKRLFVAAKDYPPLSYSQIKQRWETRFSSRHLYKNHESEGD